MIEKCGRLDEILAEILINKLKLVQNKTRADRDTEDDHDGKRNAESLRHF